MIVADSPFWLLNVNVKEGESTSMVCLFVYHWQFLIPDVIRQTSAIAQADGAP
jgi:hypothetical protein